MRSREVEAEAASKIAQDAGSQLAKVKAELEAQQLRVAILEAHAANHADELSDRRKEAHDERRARDELAQKHKLEVQELSAQKDAELLSLEQQLSVANSQITRLVAANNRVVMELNAEEVMPERWSAAFLEENKRLQLQHLALREENVKLEAALAQQRSRAAGQLGDAQHFAAPELVGGRDADEVRFGRHDLCRVVFLRGSQCMRAGYACVHARTRGGCGMLGRRGRGSGEGAMRSVFAEHSRAPCGVAGNRHPARGRPRV
jgi:hypothetical protein